MKVEALFPIGKVDPGLRDVNHRVDLKDVPKLSRQMEALGYDGLAAGETKNEPFLTLLAAAIGTERLHLSTSVAIAFPRSPMITALASWELQHVSRGRFTLGLGTQVKGHIERRYSTPWAPPSPRLREYILALRAIWDCWQYGSPLDFQGKYYTFTLMSPLFNPGPIEHPYIPIHVAAVNDHNCELAGELCDGLRAHPICTRKYIAEVMLPAVRRGAAKANRTLQNFKVVVSPMIATAETETGLAQQIQEVRMRIAFYASTRTYRPVFEIHGWGHVVDKLHQLSIQRRWEEMPGHISDEMVEDFSVVATHDELAQKIKERYGDIATNIEFAIPVHTPDDWHRLKQLIRELQR